MFVTVKVINPFLINMLLFLLIVNKKTHLIKNLVEKY